MSLIDTPPTPSDITDQLGRMLFSVRFQNATNQSALLEIVVRRALKGKKTTGRIIAARMFKGKLNMAEAPPDVRVTAGSLRKTLRKYYELEGKDDPVVISLPEPPEDRTLKLKEGEAYTPTFAYNPGLELVVKLKLGHACLERWSYDHYIRGLGIFEELLEKYPDHVGPLIGMAETICKFCERSTDNLPQVVSSWIYSQEFIEKLEKRTDEYWRLWAARGFIQHVANEQDKAKAAFDKALILDRAMTEGYAPYIEFLFRTGSTVQAIGLAMRYLLAQIDASAAQARFALFMLDAKNIDMANESLDLALKFDPGNCAGHEVAVLMGYIKKDPAFVATHMRVLRAIYTPTAYTMFEMWVAKYDEHMGIPGWSIKALDAETSAASTALVRP